MKKLIAIDALVERLAASTGRFTAKRGLAPLTRARRLELASLIKMSPKDIRTAVAAAQAHPEIFGEIIDTKEILADVAFAETIAMASSALEAFLRLAADEALARKARSAQGAVAIRRILEAATHTSRGAELSATLGTVARRAKRSRKPIATAPEAPTSTGPAASSAIAPSLPAARLTSAA